MKKTSDEAWKSKKQFSLIKTQHILPNKDFKKIILDSNKV